MLNKSILHNSLKIMTKNVETPSWNELFVCLLSFLGNAVSFGHGFRPCVL